MRNVKKVYLFPTEKEQKEAIALVYMLSFATLDKAETCYDREKRAEERFLEKVLEKFKEFTEDNFGMKFRDGEIELSKFDTKTLRKFFEDIKESYHNATFLTLEQASGLKDKLEILRKIKEIRPKSIRELANVLNKDFKQVYWTVLKLHGLGLIELVKEGNKKVPVVPYDALEFKAGFVINLNEVRENSQKKNSNAVTV
jgi:hypothetical protein